MLAAATSTVQPLKDYSRGTPQLGCGFWARDSFYFEGLMM